MRFSQEKIFFTWLIVIWFAALAFRLTLMPVYLEDYDSLYFSQAMSRYSVLTLSPHWPGYPVFVWVSKLAMTFTQDAGRALHLVSAISSSLTAIPLALLVMGWSRQGEASTPRVVLHGLIVVGLWNLVPISWIDGTEALSDPLAAFVAACLLFSSWRAMCVLEPRWLIAAGVCAGTLIGVRLAGVTLLGVLLCPVGVLWLSKLSILERFKRTGLLLLGFSVPVVVWFGWQLSVDGLRWFEVGREMLGSHHLDWVPNATEQSFTAQFFRFAATVLGSGLGGLMGPFRWDRLIVTLAWCFGLAAGGWAMLKPSLRGSFGLLIAFVVPHLIWVSLTRDLTSARYALPVVVVLIPLVVIGFSSLVNRFQSVRFGFRARSANAALLLAGVMFGIASLNVVVPLVLEHRTVPPVEQQQLQFIMRMAPGRDVTLLMREPMLFTRTMMLGVKMPLRNALTVGPNEPAFQDQQSLVLASTLNATDSQWPGWWKPIARFCRNPLLQARTRDRTDIVLFRYIPRGAGQTIQLEQIKSGLQCHRALATGVVEDR